MPKQPTEEQVVDSRRKYVHGFNETMIKIWKERITLLDVIDTGMLLRSAMFKSAELNGDVSVVRLSFEFREYGVWQNYGTGKEVYRGNPGDIGRPKVRKKKPWFMPRYYSSTMNIRDFMADSMGQQFIGIFSRAFQDRAWRHEIWPSSPVH